MFCIIGSGIAGMSCALHLSTLGPVTLLTKSKIISGSTPLAQGGIAGVINPSDSFEDHIADTLKAGRNTNNKEAVRLLVQHAPLEIKYLKNLGVAFEKNQHLEGGHSFPRVSNAKDISGKIIAETLKKHIKNTKNITIIEHAQVFELQPSSQKNTAHSLLYKNTKTQEIYELSSQYIIFATGGYSSLYNASTPPSDSIGDGISLAINAGIHTSDMHKVQFHPTVLNKKRKNKPRLLLTEAIRGMRGEIINTHGEKIVDALAPRDIVSQAIYEEQKKQNNLDCVFLDARHIPEFKKHFPFITDILKSEFNINPETDLLPITFGAHYCMGGITTNIWGETNIKNIYAIGECANTGVHGDNRLASNSLLEGLVFARQVFIDIQKKSEYNHKNISIKKIYKTYNTEISPSFLSTIQNTLSLYLSIETDKKQKIENIHKAQNIFKNMGTSNLSILEKNILVIVMKMSTDAFKKL